MKTQNCSRQKDVDGVFSQTKISRIASLFLNTVRKPSLGFQNDAYPWEDNDEMYSVENVPLCDSNEDEPLSNFLK